MKSTLDKAKQIHHISESAMIVFVEANSLLNIIYYDCF
jgi:hypothetical protein